MYSPAYLILLFTVTAIAAGFTVPKDQPDGVYSVSYENGTDVHTLIAPAVSQAEVAHITAARDRQIRSQKSRLDARQYDDTSCSGYEMKDHGACDAAVEALKNQCNPGAINTGKDFYSISGDVVAFLCNMGKNAWVCRRNDITDDYAWITKVCGWYISGYRNRGSGDSRISIGY
jgi:hypothetical protein